MATLTSGQLAEMRRKLFAARDITTAATKPNWNAAFQALEDWYESQRARVKTDVDAATSPVRFTNAELKAFAREYLAFKKIGGG